MLGFANQDVRVREEGDGNEGVRVREGLRLIIFLCILVIVVYDCRMSFVCCSYGVRMLCRIYGSCTTVMFMLFYFIIAENYLNLIKLVIHYVCPLRGKKCTAFDHVSSCRSPSKFLLSSSVIPTIDVICWKCSCLVKFDSSTLRRVIGFFMSAS